VGPYCCLCLTVLCCGALPIFACLGWVSGHVQFYYRYFPILATVLSLSGTTLCLSSLLDTAHFYSYYYYVSGDGVVFWRVSCIMAFTSRAYGSFVCRLLICPAFLFLKTFLLCFSLWSAASEGSIVYINRPVTN